MRIENYILKIAWGIVFWGFKGECYPFSNAAHVLGFQKQKQREVVLKLTHVRTLSEERFHKNVNLILPWLLFPLKQPSLTQLERGLFITVVTEGSLGFSPSLTLGNLSSSFFWNGHGYSDGPCLGKALYCEQGILCTAQGPAGNCRYLHHSG